MSDTRAPMTRLPLPVALPLPCLALAVVLLGPTAGHAVFAAPDLTILVDRAHVAPGEVVEPAAIDIADSRIVAVRRASTAAPTARRILDARGHVAIAGFVDVRSGAGLPTFANEEASEVTAAFPTVEALDAASEDFERALRSGITSAALAPGGRAVVGGLVGVVKTDRRRPLEQRLLERDAALFITLGYEPVLGNRLSRFQQPRGLYFRRPGNRMGVVAEVRRAAFLAREGGEDESARQIRRALRGEIPTFFRARTESDVRTALRLSEQAGFRPVLVEPIEAHRLPERVAASGAIAVVGPFYQQPRDPLEGWEGADFRHATARILAEAGVPVAIGSGPGDAPDRLRELAILAHRAGLSADDALAAITTVPARALGLEARVGTLRPGADADIVLLDGEPLELTSAVTGVIVEGRVVHRDRAKLPAGVESRSVPSAEHRHAP